MKRSEKEQRAYMPASTGPRRPDRKKAKGQPPPTATGILYARASQAKDRKARAEKYWQDEAKRAQKGPDQAKS